MKNFRIILKDKKGKEINLFTEKLTFQEAVCVAYQKRAMSGFQQSIVGVIET